MTFFAIRVIRVIRGQIPVEAASCYAEFAVCAAQDDT